jgi:hypothetical protein
VGAALANVVKSIRVTSLQVIQSFCDAYVDTTFQHPKSYRKEARVPNFLYRDHWHPCLSWGGNNAVILPFSAVF